MSYRDGAGLGDVPGEAGSKPVRTRYPSGPNAGELADRYATYADVPFLLKPLAQQLGAAGYWYAPPANPLDTLSDQGSRVFDQVPVALNAASDAATSLVESSAKWVVLGIVGYLVIPALVERGRRR